MAWPTALLCAAAASSWLGGADALDQSLADCQAVALRFSNTCVNSDGSALTGGWPSSADGLEAVTCTADGQVCPDGTAR